MSPKVRTRHGEVTAELAWSGSGSRSEITPAVGRTVHLPPPPTWYGNSGCNRSATVRVQRRCCSFFDLSQLVFSKMFGNWIVIFE
ncbi:hypothetical protein Hanom_Chr01g00033861 [Helianthus anomalus]